LTFRITDTDFSIMINATPQQLRKAADIKERIDALQEELNKLLGGEGEILPPPQVTEAPRKKWTVGPAGRARMRAAQKARWAAIKGTAPETGPAPKKKRKMSAEGIANIRAGVAKRMAARGGAEAVQKPKRRMSAAGRAAISAAAKARWAKFRAA
jgi:hypothetical protein